MNTCTHGYTLGVCCNRIAPALSAPVEAAPKVEDTAVEPATNLSEAHLNRLFQREYSHQLPGDFGLASDYRNAIGGDGVRATDWEDKPHRLVYDLLRVADLYASRTRELEKRLAWNYGVTKEDWPGYGGQVQVAFTMGGKNFVTVGRFDCGRWEHSAGPFRDDQNVYAWAPLLGAPPVTAAYLSQGSKESKS